MIGKRIYFVVIVESQPGFVFCILLQILEGPLCADSGSSGNKFQCLLWGKQTLRFCWPGTDPDEEMVAQIGGLNYSNLGNLIAVFILLALLRVFASLASRFDIFLFWKSNLCEEGFSNSNCLIMTVKFVIDLISLISSIARLRLVKRLAVDVGSIWGEGSISSLLSS